MCSFKLSTIPLKLKSKSILMLLNFDGLSPNQELSVPLLLQSKITLIIASGIEELTEVSLR